MQNNIKFGHSQYLTNKNVNLFIFQIKNDIEFFWYDWFKEYFI